MMLLMECPSGLKGRVRGLKMKELKLLGDRKAMRDGDAYDVILSSCVEVTDYGPAYQASSFSWDKALQGDGFKALMDIRRATYWDATDGELSFDLRIQCSRCEEPIDWRLWLGDLPMQSYPKASISKHLAGEDFATTLDGRKVTFRLPTREIEKHVDKLIRTDKDPVTAALAYRLLTVEGIGDKKADIRKWIDEVDVASVSRFRAEQDALSGGVETSFEAECAKCGARTPVDLPFGGPGFWTPKKPGSPKPTKKTGDQNTKSPDSAEGSAAKQASEVPAAS